MSEINNFLISKGINPSDVIYNMNNTNNPKIDLSSLLEDYRNQLDMGEIFKNFISGFYEWHKSMGYVSIKMEDWQEYINTLKLNK